MARTIKEIAEEIKVAFISNETLRTAYGFDDYDENGDEATQLDYYESKFSKVSVESCLIYAIATCMATMEHLMDWFKSDVQQVVDNERYGHLGWYAKKMKEFRFGQGFPDGEVNYDDTYNDWTEEDIENMQIIKYASAIDNGRSVSIKIAKDDGNGAPAPLEIYELAEAEVYINMIKPAGIPITLINEAADELDVSVKVVYNPLVFETETAVENAVETAIKKYLNNVEFNGKFVAMTMIDYLQEVEGIKIAQVNHMEATRAGFSAVDITGQTSYIPSSGYLHLNSLEVIIED